MRPIEELSVPGLLFPEGVRWHRGWWWLSDQHGHRVLAVNPGGDVREVTDLDDMPSGLGFLPGGDLLIACMRSQQVRRMGARGTDVYADLSAYGPGIVNDMVVDGDGYVYVGQKPTGYAAVEDTPGWLIVIRPDRSHGVAASGLLGPNGVIVRPDRSSLVVAETAAHRLTEFSIGADGTLSDRRVFADLGDRAPDGICLDESGALWVAAPFRGAFLHVDRGGAVLESVLVESGWPVACVLGGERRCDLLMAVAETTVANVRSLGSGRRDQDSDSRGRLQIARVDSPGSGWP